jgi:glycosyltransferase involved in cell wall biosynthesis
MPLVSIIIPCYNEQATIRLLLDAICEQTFCKPTQGEPTTRELTRLPGSLEVIIADGLSTDRTREEVAAFQQAHPELPVCLVDNPKRIIPAALNCALAAAQGQYIIRLDAHSVPAPDYVERCVEDLQAGRGDNVGGVWEIRSQGNERMQRAIAMAAAHPLGVGDARYRYTSEAGYVDTVPFGAFRRDVFTRFGQFDEGLLTNEDYEFNARLLQGGGRIWLNPRIRSTYFARSSLGALSSQYWRYGYWKWRMLRRYPKTLRWRQGLPPVFVLSLVILLLMAPVWGLARLLLGAELILYSLILAAGALPVARRQSDLWLVLAIPLAIFTMHMSWGAGFLWSMATSFRKQAVGVGVATQ